VYLLAFQAYINEMHGSRSKISSKKSRQAALRGGFNSGVRGLMHTVPLLLRHSLFIYVSIYLIQYFIFFFF
jgi:hypothetical protein